MTTAVGNIDVSGGSIPLFVYGVLKIPNACGFVIKTYQIRPIIPGDENELNNFLQNYVIPSLGNPIFNDRRIAGAESNFWIKKHVNDNPWSSYQIRDSGANALIGIYTISVCLGVMGQPGSLDLTLQLGEVDQKEEIVTRIWRWTVEKLLPAMMEKGVQVDGKSLEVTRICTVTCLDDMANILEKVGFTLTNRSIYISKKVNQLLTYEISMEDALKSRNDSSDLEV